MVVKTDELNARQRYSAALQGNDNDEIMRGSLEYMAETFRGTYGGLRVTPIVQDDFMLGEYTLGYRLEQDPQEDEPSPGLVRRILGLGKPIPAVLVEARQGTIRDRIYFLVNGKRTPEVAHFCDTLSVSSPSKIRIKKLP